ncbi:MAG TPA: esterase-like activity of phytase family protein, partial [Ideonella sp.]|nr:esterase-like activity of phytase family protein [Ideonella sp.]
QIVPTGTLFEGTQIGGLSGLDYDARSGLYSAISDDRSQNNPARFYELGLDLSRFVRSNTPGADAVSFSRVTTLRTPAGEAFAPFTVDPESIRLLRPARGAGGGSYTLLWTNEGQRATGAFQNPTLREMDVNGNFLREFAVPSLFNPAGSTAADQLGDTGIRNNLAFESLAVSPDRRTVFIANEDALAQDGPVAAFGVKSPVRIASFDSATGAPGSQWVYETDGVIDAPAPGASANNGLVELLATGPKCFLALERSFTSGVGNSIRVYLADAHRATDVAALPALAGASYTPLRKTLALDLADVRNDDGSRLVLDNTEGLSLGPVVNGLRTFVLMSDNNFSTGQFTQFAAFGVDPAQKVTGCRLPE